MICCMADFYGERGFFLQMLAQIMESPNMTMLLGSHKQMCLDDMAEFYVCGTGGKNIT